MHVGVMRTRTFLLAVICAALYNGLGGCGTKSIAGAPVAATGSSSTTIRTSSYWVAPAVGSTNQLGTVVLPANSGKDQELLRPVITSNSGPLKCVNARWNAESTQLTITYSMGATLLHVTVQPVASATGFQVQLDADQPGVTSVNMGNWDNSLDTIPIPVPYYTSDVW
jgi:hypothetical protein